MSKAKIFLASAVWLVILSIGVFLYRLWYVPTVEKQAEQKQEEVLDKTSGNSNYKHRLTIGLDGFSGYAILRSAEMNQQLRSRGIKVNFEDDGANYPERLAALASGQIQMAAFPIDALLKASEQSGSLPATIIAVIDETRGADALVAYKNKFPNIDALNAPDTRFVLVGDSPSETLVRVLLNNFQLGKLSADSLTRLSTEKGVVARYNASIPGGNDVFVTWEPVVSELLENDQMHTLFDSSQQSGFIVDTLVVSRDFLIKNEPVVRDVLESYFSALYTFDQSKLVTLVMEDATNAGAKLTEPQAQKLVQGIAWKNTQENFAHFGLRSASVSHVEDMIDRIKRVLIKTGGLKNDPTSGQSSRLFYEQALRDLQASGFHPGVSPESVREDIALTELSESQWARLEPVGTVDVPPLIYARGTSRLTESSMVKLDSLLETLETFPRYYLMVRGNASSRGDAEANRKLAKQRADAALQYLLQKGVPSARLRAMDGEITGQTSVTFVLGQIPY